MPRLSSLPLNHLKLTDAFWAPRQAQLVEVTLPHQWEQLEATGRLENFRRVIRKEQGKFEGYYFNDSDVYKWLEAMAYALTFQRSPELEAKAEQAIKLIGEAQEPDGYVNTFFQYSHPEEKWLSLSAMHEMYCGGHMIEAAVAWSEHHGNTEFLKIAVKWADLLVATFGTDKRQGYPGHEEVELALFKLAAHTGNTKYSDLARYFLEERGKRPSIFQAESIDPEVLKLSPWVPKMLGDKSGAYTGEYLQDHLPLLEHTEVVGHAVRAVYLYMAATDLAKQTEDEKLVETLERVWNNLVTSRLYITGGLGPSGENEGFTSDFDLPNLTAYAETCASIGLVLWGQRMLELTGSALYVDIIERSLYNALLSGIGLDGKSYFYDNPLESRGQHKRTPWFVCACCPPNIARLIGQVGQLAVSTSSEAIAINIPMACEFEVEVGGVSVKGQIESNYPWEGAYKLTLHPTKAAEFEVRIRIPEWAEEVETDVPGLEEEAEYDSGYAVIKKLWQPGDTVSVQLTMNPNWLEANPKVRDDLGRAAMTRGPLVYCAEKGVDNNFAPQLFAADVEAEVTELKVGDAVLLGVKGTRESESFFGELYSPIGTTEYVEAELRMIPYYAWANELEPEDKGTEMQVWFRRL
jgi:DUF1680 family protein